MRHIPPRMPRRSRRQSRRITTRTNRVLIRTRMGTPIPTRMGTPIRSRPTRVAIPRKVFASVGIRSLRVGIIRLSRRVRRRMRMAMRVSGPRDIGRVRDIRTSSLRSSRRVRRMGGQIAVGMLGIMMRRALRGMHIIRAIRMQRRDIQSIKLLRHRRHRRHHPHKRIQIQTRMTKMMPPIRTTTRMTTTTMKLMTMQRCVVHTGGRVAGVKPVTMMQSVARGIRIIPVTPQRVHIMPNISNIQENGKRVRSQIAPCCVCTSLSKICRRNAVSISATSGLPARLSVSSGSFCTLNRR